MSNRQKLHKFQQQLLTKYRDFTATPAKALATVNCSSQWEVDQHFAITKLYKSLAEPVGVALFSGFTYRWEKYYLEKPVVMATAKQREYWEKQNPNRWLRNRIKMIRRGAQLFPVAISHLKSDGLRTMEAQVWTLKCVELARECLREGQTMTDIVQEVQLLADKWGFKPVPPKQTSDPFEGESSADYDFRLKEDIAWFHLDRLLNEDWWKQRIEVAYRQFCEHCQIIAGRVRKNTSEYLSVAGRADYKARQDASIIALSQVVAVNEETGEEVPALDIIAKSTSNPAIRRNELMVRCDGFSLLAQEFNLICGFFTMTAPSRFHACTTSKDKKRAFDNTYYRGASPKQTQKYLSKIWAQARAKLKRMNIHLFGFRVCEPHHDGTPHWHAQFFFREQDEQAIRFVIADYFTKEDRDELHVNRDDFKAWAKSIKKGYVTANEFAPENEAARKHIYSVTQRIKRRFDYKRIEGSATAYIAKYISKNVDGYKLDNDEETGTPADVKAYAVRGWASTWCIRQFQQIGGAPVSVWRELRKMEKTPDEVTEMKAKQAAKARGEKFVSTRKIESFYDLQKQHDSIEIARKSAHDNNWSMYIYAMGGIFCSRKDHPIKMLYKDAQSKYGETVKKLHGITSGTKDVVTRTGTWKFTHKMKEEVGFETGAKRPCGSYNNCTVSITDDEKQEVSQLLIDRGEKVDERILSELFSYQPVVLESRWVGDVKRTVWGQLKKNVVNIGGNFRLRVWDTNIKRNVTYIDPPKVRFENDLLGKKNAFFDAKPASKACIENRVKRQEALHPLDWQAFEENVAKNGKYVAPVKDISEYVRGQFTKGNITERSFNEYLALCKHYNGAYSNDSYLKFKANEVDQLTFHQQMDLLARFSDESHAGTRWWSGMFDEHVKGLAPFSPEYEVAVKTWSEVYED